MGQGEDRMGRHLNAQNTAFKCIVLPENNCCDWFLELGIYWSFGACLSLIRPPIWLVNSLCGCRCFQLWLGEMGWLDDLSGLFWVLCFLFRSLNEMHLNGNLNSFSFPFSSRIVSSERALLWVRLPRRARISLALFITHTNHYGHWVAGLRQKWHAMLNQKMIPFNKIWFFNTHTHTHKTHEISVVEGGARLLESIWLEKGLNCSFMFLADSLGAVLKLPFHFLRYSWLRALPRFFIPQ